MEQARSIEGPGAAAMGSSDLATAMARRSAAFDAGEDAFWNGAIGADAYMLYRLLVRLCREQTWCWPGLQWLAERTRVSVGTIKRRLDELERAGLIARQQRPGGMTARTSVLALASPNSGAQAAAMVEQSDDDAAETAARAEDAFFCARGTITDAPTSGSAVIRHTTRVLTTNGGGGEESDASRLLRLGGVLSPRVRAELAERSTAEIQRCLELAQAQPNVKDPAALAVTLLRSNGAGRTFEQRTQGRPDQRRSRALIGAATAGGAAVGPVEAGRARDGGELVPDADARAAYGALWREVCARLADSLDADALTTWFADAALAMLGDAEAVVAVGSVFARAWIDEHARAPLERAFCAALGRDVRVAVVIP